MAAQSELHLKPVYGGFYVQNQQPNPSFNGTACGSPLTPTLGFFVRRKRLNHVAETLCSMFCGWRLMNSYGELQALGSGILEIDALAPSCKFNGASTETLSIAHELHAWLLADLHKHNIHLWSLAQATLSVAIHLQKSPAPSNPRGNFYIGKSGMPIHKGEFFKLEVRCKSEVKTDEANYSANKIHFEQWPVGWPQT